MNKEMNRHCEPLEPTYTAEEVAKHYHVTATTVRRWVARGLITALNVSQSGKGPYVFRKQDLEKFENRTEVTKNEQLANDG